MAALPPPKPAGATGQAAAAPAVAPNLRSKAEARLRLRAALPVPSLHAPQAQASEQALHELQVHQIELEMQNEELQRNQVELNAANRRYFDLYDLAPVGYCTLSEGDLILQTNLTASTMLGLERSALVRQPFSRFIYREDMDRFYLMCRALRNTGQAQAAELRMVQRDGTLFWARVATNISPDTYGAPQLRLVLSDISERKAHELEREHHRTHLEEQVRRGTQEFRDLYDQAPCGYHSLSLEGVVLRANRTELALLGYSQEEYVGHPVVDFMTPDSAQRFHDRFPQVLKAGRLRNIELDFCCKNGSVRPFLVHSDVATVAPGETPCFHSTMVDISERKQNEKRLELALMGADLGLWDLQYPGGELHLSARACAMLGYPEDGLGTHFNDLEERVHPDDAPARRLAINAAKNGDVPYHRQEFRLRHREGHWVWVRSQGRVVARDDKSNALRAVGTLQDISHEKHLKLESTDLLQRIEALIHAIGKVPEAPPEPVPAAPAAVLGSREQQVIQLIAAGCTSAEIGTHLGISTSTAATHRRNLMRKLDLHSAAELTRYALAHKLIRG